MHVQRSNNVVESTGSEVEITPYKTLENISNVRNTGAHTTYMEADDKQIMYNEIKERVTQPDFDPSPLEKKLLAGVVHQNPNFDEDKYG